MGLYEAAEIPEPSSSSCLKGYPLLEHIHFLVSVLEDFVFVCLILGQGLTL